MGQSASQFLDCRFWRRDNSEQLKHQQLLNDLKLMQQQTDQKKVLSLKQRQKSLQQPLPRQPTLLESRISAQHEHILKYSLLSFPRSMEYEAGGFIEIPEMSLHDILQTKLNTNQHFPPNDIHAMFGGLLSAMAYLEANNLNHHDIHPTSIYYSNSRYKLSNPITSQSGYQRTFNHKRFSYLSPELIEALVNGVAIDDHTLLFKPDVFSLGMVMLECCCLQSSSQCYDGETYGILEVNVRNRLNAIEARYSRSVSQLIQFMLEPDPKKRMSANQLFEFFQNPQSLRTSKPGLSAPTAPLPLDVSSVNPRTTRVPVPTRDTLPTSPATDRASREYNIIVTPPPPANMSSSLSLSTVNPPLSPVNPRGLPSRPPTFNPNNFGTPVSLPSGTLPTIMERKQPVNLKQIDHRIDRILTGNRNYN